MASIQLDLTQLQAEHSELQAFLSQPQAFSDPDYAKKTRRLSELDILLERGARQAAVTQQLAEARELSYGSDELADLAKEEIPLLEAEAAQIDAELFELLAPKDPNDEKDVIVEIRAGAGGDEASLFAA